MDYSIIIFLLQVSIYLTDFVSSATKELTGDEAKCCKGILGYPAVEPFMPCSGMRCCNQSETVVVVQVNEALGFCLRCMARTHLKDDCYKNNADVISTNDHMDYKPRACCEGSKFEVQRNLHGTAMAIQCIPR
ncbi:hypothetical protein ScPMuIL_012488 [Solemya velum]